MSYRIIIDDIAIHEAQDAFEYYESKQTGLGEKFKVELNNGIESLRTNPEHNRRIKSEIRQCLLGKFPYVVVYEILKDKKNIIIYSVFHTSRNPGKKLEK